MKERPQNAHKGAQGCDSKFSSSRPLIPGARTIYPPLPLTRPTAHRSYGRQQIPLPARGREPTYGERMDGESQSDEEVLLAVGGRSRSLLKLSTHSAQNVASGSFAQSKWPPISCGQSRPAGPGITSTRTITTDGGGLCR